jgi:hypothetical protein
MSATTDQMREQQEDVDLTELLFGERAHQFQRKNFRQPDVARHAQVEAVIRVASLPTQLANSFSSLSFLLCDLAPRRQSAT